MPPTSAQGPADREAAVNLFDTGGQPKESQTRRTPGPSPTRHRSCRKVSR